MCLLRSVRISLLSVLSIIWLEGHVSVLFLRLFLVADVAADEQEDRSAIMMQAATKPPTCISIATRKQRMKAAPAVMNQPPMTETTPVTL